MTYETGAAYFLPDGVEVLYFEDDGVPMVSFPRVKTWPPRKPEALDGRTLSPRMVTCDEGHTYHLRVEIFPITERCPHCETGDIEEWFRANNYTLSHTGGGCTGWEWIYDREDGGHWLVMATDDSSAPRSSDDLYQPIVGIYEIDGEGDYVDECGTWGDWMDTPMPERIPQAVRQWAQAAVDVFEKARPWQAEQEQQ